MKDTLSQKRLGSSFFEAKQAEQFAAEVFGELRMTDEGKSVFVELWYRNNQLLVMSSGLKTRTDSPK